MYHPEVIAANRAKIESAYGCELREYTVSEIEEWVARLRDVPAIPDPPPTLKRKADQLDRRQLTEEEAAFIQNELLLTKIDYRYWAERYSFISIEGSGLARLTPFWESQELILHELARLELEAFLGQRLDGLLIALLKARQLGGSTLSQSLLAHRASTQNNLFGLIAADAPEQSAYLFDMFERVFFNLPWYIRPTALEHTKSPGELKLDGGTNIWTGAGKSTRGKESERGQLGRGKTLPLGHLSEISTWDDTKQIDASLIPTMPRTLRTFVLFESTAKGRNDYWHKFWKAAKAGDNRFTPVFIPWYAEKTKYTAIPPPAWSPSITTLAHAKTCEDTGPRWLHRPVRLTKGQLYWYEQTRRSYEAQDRLGLFLENYCANDEEAFQFSGHTVFNVKTVQRIVDMAKPLVHTYEVGPHTLLDRTP